MVVSQKSIEAELAELVEESFVTFCEETGAMFGRDMGCEQKEVCTETVKGLKKRFKKIVAVNVVKSKGTLNGNFYVIFDHEGLFTLGGVVVMLPESRILDNRKQGSAKEAGEMSDAVKEAGNLLIGSFDKVFRDGFTGHGHFLQTNTFIGEPWDKPDEKIGLGLDEESVFVSCEMKIDPYSGFQCGVIFPKKIFGGASQDVVEEPAGNEVKLQETAVTKDKQIEVADTPASAEVKSPVNNTSEKPLAEVNLPLEKSIPPKAEQQTLQTTSETANFKTSPDLEEPLNEENKKLPSKVISSSLEDAQTATSQPVQTVIPQIECAQVVDTTEVPHNLHAETVMQKDVVWCSCEEGLGEVLTKMQQRGVNYVLAGKEGTVEGIISMTDLKSGMSPYLRPEFAKWRRSLDDASLQIKVKWLMTKVVHSVKAEDTLTNVAENMCRSGVRCLPVVNKEGKVVGLINVFDVLHTLSPSNSDIAAVK